MSSESKKPSSAPAAPQASKPALPTPPVEQTFRKSDEPGSYETKIGR